MHTLRRLILDYEPVDVGQAQVKERFIALIVEQSDCLFRSCLPGHLTASAWVVDRGGTRFLLHHHKKLGRWLQLGGHADGEANLLGAALKEVVEESGLTEIEALSRSIFDLDIHTIPAHASDPEHLHFDVRFVITAVGDPVCSSESHEVSWLTAAQVRDLVNDDSVLRLLDKWERAKDFAGPTS